MSRPLRIEFSGALYHVMARGNAREAIFQDDEDRQVFCSGLARACERFEWRLWAYCLMDNHYHLLIETLKPTLSRGMREVNGVYTQAFNRHHRRAGHVLQGRYKAVLVDKDSYLAETLALFSSDCGAARRAYARFVAEGVEQSLPEAKQQLYLGDEDFAARMATRATRISSEIPRQQRAHKSLAQYEREATERNAAIEAAYASGAYTLKAIGEHFGLHYATVSRIARRRIWQ